MADFRAPASASSSTTPVVGRSKKPLPATPNSTTKLQESGIRSLSDLRTPKDATRSVTPLELTQLKRSQLAKSPLVESPKNLQPKDLELNSNQSSSNPEASVSKNVAESTKTGSDLKAPAKRKLSSDDLQQTVKPQARLPPKRPKKEASLFIPKKKLV